MAQLSVKISEQLASIRLNVDIQIPLQGVTALFGASGAGKTTLLRCIAGLHQAQNAYIQYADQIWQSDKIFVKPQKRPIGYVFQEPSLFSHLSVAENLAFASKRADSKNQTLVYQDIVNLLDIAPLLTRSVGQLSGGEKQRVAIARTLLIQPQLLLMDEPLSRLDIAKKNQVLPYIEMICHKLNIPVIYVSHSIDEVARLADHLVLLDKGQVEDQGLPDRVLNQFTQQLTTDQDLSVIWSGQVVAIDETWQLAKVNCYGLELLVPKTQLSLKKSERIRIAARDVSITLTKAQDSSMLNILPAEIVEMSELSATSQLIKLSCQGHIVLAQITKLSVQKLQLTLNKSVFVQIKSLAIVH